MPKPTIAILGGAFDPIHHGHMEVAHQILNHGAADDVWIMPAHGHIYDKRMVHPSHRLEMVKRATQDEPRIHPFDYEIKHRLTGSTHEFFQKLLADPAMKGINFKMGIGQDNADTFHKWKNAEELKRMVPFVVMARAGSPPPDPNSWYLQKPHQYVPNQPIYRTSSTEVKSMLGSNHPMVPKLLHPGVLDYIHTHQLYRPDGEKS